MIISLPFPIYHKIIGLNKRKRTTFMQAWRWFFVTSFMRFAQSFRTNYSIIVATRPEPTVRPPSRALGNKIWMFFLVFAIYYSSYYLIWNYISTVLKNFRAKIEPMKNTDFLLIRLYYMVPAPCLYIINKKNRKSLLPKNGNLPFLWWYKHSIFFWYV